MTFCFLKNKKMNYNISPKTQFSSKELFVGVSNLKSTHINISKAHQPVTFIQV